MADFNISAAQIERATDGTVNQKIMVNWNDRNLWLTPVQEVSRGKPRFYSYANAIEAALAAALVGSGLRREAVNELIALRCVHASGRSSGWSGEFTQMLETLPEWGWDSAWWVIVDKQGTKAVLAVENVSDVDPDVFKQEVVRVVNLRVIKSALDASLAH